MEGYVGLRTYNGAARFRNLKVTRPHGEVLWKGLPELSLGATPTTETAAIPPTRNPADWPAPTIIGDWTLEGDELVTEGKHKERQAVVFGDPGWQEYDLRVEVMEESSLEEGKQTMENCILVHADDAGTQYWKIDIGAFDNSSDFDLLACVDGEYPWKMPSRRFRRGVLDGTLGKWNVVEVQVRKTKIAVSVDGMLIAESECTKLTHGRVGASSYNVGRGRWRNFKVTSPDGQLLWKGFPDLPNVPKSETKSTDLTEEKPQS
jgi:hypothetical protein